MLLWFVILYLMVSVGIGLYAATRVHNAKDFAVAGRSLPLPVVTATVFATWFGAEAVFGVSATFVKDGLGGVVADPFGSSMCLIIAGIIFSRYLYKLNIMTLGDFYRMRYNRTVEVLTTICIVLSYLGWVAAQIKALGLIFYVVTDGAVSQEAGMILGAAIVLSYTIFGGMFSVAILDFVQMAVSMGGLLFIAWTVSGKVGGGATAVIDHASAAGKLKFFPDPDPWLWLTFIGTWMTMMLGSIPQQDVFQRVTSAKSARIALWGSVLGASIYFCFTFVPMFIAYSATLIDPAMFGELLEKDSQLVLPTLVLQHTPVFAQVLFFGAVLSAIMSCSSATCWRPRSPSPRTWSRASTRTWATTFLRVMRGCLVGFRLHGAGGGAEVRSIDLQDGGKRLQGDPGRRLRAAGRRHLLAPRDHPGRAGRDLRRPAVLGADRGADRRSQPGAAATDRAWASRCVGMVAGSLLPQWVGHRLPGQDPHAILHHHAAAQTHHAEPEHRH
jgi:SSS family solute:Na+ symporter